MFNYLESSPGRSLFHLCEALSSHRGSLGQAHAAQQRELLRRHLRPNSFGGASAHLISPEQIARVLENVAKSHGTREAGALHAQLSAAYEFGLRRRDGLISTYLPDARLGFIAFEDLIGNPMLAVPAMWDGDANVAARALNESELGHVLRHLEAGMTAAVDRALGCRLLLFNLGLAGQRTAQLLRVGRKDVQRRAPNDVLMRLPGVRPNYLHDVIVCGAALRQLEWFERRSEAMGSPLLFPSEHLSASLSQEIMHRTARLLSCDLAAQGAVRAPFTVHDLRRTCRLMLHASGVNPAQAVALQDGRCAALSGYTLLSLEDRRRTLDGWNAKLARLQQLA